MRNKIYLYIFLFVLSVGLPFSLWLAAFFSPAFAGKIYPKDKVVTNNASPVISYKWLKTPFVAARSARLFINDTEVKSIKLTKRGIEFKAPKLDDGPYRAYVLVKYGFPYYKQVREAWIFEVDTEAPQIELNFINGKHKGNTVATSQRILSVKGKTEKGARVFIAGQIGGEIELAVDSSGNFLYEISLAKEKNEFKIKAADKAKNRTEGTLLAVKDEKPPVFKSIIPAGDKLVAGYPTDLSVSANDGESWVDRAEFALDGDINRVVELKAGKDGSFQGPLDLDDGRYSGQFKLYDGAGHSASKTVSFEVSTVKVEVSRSKRELLLYKLGKVVKTYKVAVGKPGKSTPAGNFRIINKRSNPTWINPGSSWAKDMPGRIPPGPDNPLGTRAMDLSVDLIRIHGTPNAASIGRATSNGCIRMYKWEAEDLYRRVKVGTPVIIY